MNSWQFYQYTQYPDNLNLHDEVQLRGLIKDYPYFQAAHLLLAKCLKNQDNYSFEKQLKLAALYAPNRSLLYSLLKSAGKRVMIEEIAFPVIEKTVETPVTVEEESIEIMEEVIEVSAAVAEETINTAIDTESDSNEIETTEQKETPIAAEDLDRAEETPAETVEPELPAGVIYITETITQEISDADTVITDTFIEETIIEEKTVISDTIIEEIVIEDKLTEEVIFEEVIISDRLNTTETVIEPPLAERAFSEWLKQTASSDTSVFLGDRVGANIFKQPETSYIIPSKAAENFEGLTMLSLAKTELTQPSTPTANELPIEVPKRTFSDDILEKFITSNPTISRPKTEFYNPSKAAKKSLEPDENLVTETLAKIALKQGNYLKALKIYEKLSLKFPEKFTIFATQIKKIKTDNNLE
ncbi:MAG: hypothetical protein SGJ10_10115 [Bacteroidota bacterium]|nr:hypothetical protein [Bacteroidota bacterium]